MNHIHDRIQRALTTSAESITLDDLAPSEVRRTARRRSVRRHRTIVGGAVAASMVTMVVGVQQFSSTSSGGALRTSTGETSADASSSDAVATPPATPVPAGRLPDGTQPAQLTDPSFVWKVVDPGQSYSIHAAFSDGPASTFPGLALSTAPGRAAESDVAQSIWRTDDGVTWNQTDLVSPFGSVYLSSGASSGGNLFAIGTAPGIAATSPNPLQVAVASVDGTDWVTTDLPFDTNDLGDVPYGQTVLDRFAVALDDASALVAVTPTFSLDVQAITRANDIELDRLSSIDDNGLLVVDRGCAPSTVPATTIVLRQGEQPPEGTVPTGELGDCTTLTALSWADLGVPDETVSALTVSATQFFRVTPDGSVSPVESPLAGARLTLAGGGPNPVVQAIDSFGQRRGTDSYLLTDAGWTTITLAAVNWMLPPSRIGDATVGWGWAEGGGGPFLARLDDDGTAAYIDPSPLFGDNTLLSPSRQVVAAGRSVSVMAESVDPIAMAGGVEFTSGGVVVRQDSLQSSFYFLDAETRERIPEGRIAQDDVGYTLTNDDGSELGRIVYTDIDALMNDYLIEAGDTSWEITTTADGVSFSVESVANLLGIEQSKIQGVYQTSTDGTQIVLTVTLTERYPDDTPRQLALVGTPVN